MAENKHRWKIQLGAALASNPFLMNFLHGRISRTGLKAVCVPGLNCYSCPAAAASCPIGALQAVIGSSKFQFAWYVVGFLIFAGALLGRVVCGGMIIAALAHSTIVGWCTTSIDNYEFRLHPVDRFALRQTPSYLGFLAGSAVAYLAVFAYPLAGTQLDLLMVAFALVLVVAFCVYGGDDAQARKRLNELLAPPAAERALEAAGDVGADQSGPGFFRKRCELVAQRYALTPREEEVFLLLAKGRNAEHIAEQLVVSPATAKSHIYHIYRKLDISSQQHLMNIVEDYDGE